MQNFEADYDTNLQLSSKEKHNRRECTLVARPLVDISGGMTSPSFIHSTIHSFNKYVLSIYYGQIYSYKQTSRNLTYILGQYDGEQNKDILCLQRTQSLIIIVRARKRRKRMRQRMKKGRRNSSLYSMVEKGCYYKRLLFQLIALS